MSYLCLVKEDISYTQFVKYIKYDRLSFGLYLNL